MRPAEVYKITQFWIWNIFIAGEVHDIIICEQYIEISSANSGTRILFLIIIAYFSYVR